MMARLGRVLYWASLILAAAVIALGFLAGFNNGFNTAIVIVWIIAVLTIVLIGRAMLYVFSDR